MRVSWLPDVLRAAGLTVIELDGWRGRGRDLSSIRGVVWHDTVTPRSVEDTRVARLLRDGHSTLPGPLAQLGLDRAGRFWMIADGRCNHNGYGRWGNSAIGIETFANGGGTSREPWNPAQQESAVVGTRAILRHLGLPNDRAEGHKEQDPNRKIDPWGIDTNDLRRRVAAPKTKEWDEMATKDEIKDALREVFEEITYVMAVDGKQYLCDERLRLASYIPDHATLTKLVGMYGVRDSIPAGEFRGRFEVDL